MSELVPQLSQAEARSLTDEILGTADRLDSLLLRAEEGRAWSALGYPSWRDYATAEFGMSQSRAYQLLNQAKVIREIEADANSTNVELPSEGQARELVRAPEGRRSEVWNRAIEQAGGKPTAAIIRQIRQEVAPRPLTWPTPAPQHIPQVPGQVEIVDAEIIEDFDFAPAPLSFTCYECGESFNVEVWHCKCCDHHWSSDQDDACKNCISLGCARCLSVDDEPDADLLDGQLWVPTPSPAPAPTLQPAPRPMPAPPALTPQEREEHIRLAAKQEYLNAYSGAVDGLIALESYAASGCTPPAEIPDNYPALPVVVGRIAAVLSTWKNWNTAR